MHITGKHIPYKLTQFNYASSQTSLKIDFYTLIPKSMNMARMMIQLKVLRLMLILVFFYQPVSWAQTNELDKNAAYEKHYPAINYSSLRKALDLGQVFIIDANSEETFRKGHIPLARSINNTELLSAQLPVIKSYPIVVYCGASYCTAWHKAADFSAARGYTNVMHYKEGLKGWKEKGDTLATGKTR